MTNLSSQQSIKIKKNLYDLKWEGWRPFRVGVPFWVHKELSSSYREGTAPKLKTMAFPYKMKGLEKILVADPWGPVPGGGPILGS